MVLERVIVLSLLVTQALSAPSGCIESCSSYLGSYQTQTSGGYQDHAGLTQAATNLQNFDQTRPGTWSEHNEYRTDGGRGKVHEERGQYVDGSRRVRYFKKNYTSSYSSVNGAGLSDIEQQHNNYRHALHASSTQPILDSQRTYDQIGNSESLVQQHEYDRIHSERERLRQREQSSFRRTGTKSERLEDFGEYSRNSQVAQQGVSDINSETVQGQYHHTETRPSNWSRVDSYKTDGGHGRVFEEEGQYVTGPKKVRYYKKNYTSSYSTGGIPSDVSITGIHDVHKELEKLHREIGQEFHQLSTAGNIASSNIAQTNIDAMGVNDRQTVGTDHYRQQIDQGGLSIGTASRNTEHHSIDTSSGISEHLPYVNPSQSTYGTERHSVYERHEGHVSRIEPTSQYINPTSGYTDVITNGNSGYHSNTYNRGTAEQHTVDDHRQTELLNSHQTRVSQNQQYDSNMRQNIYNQNTATYPSVPGPAHYREEWSSSSHTRETSAPHRTTGSLHVNEQNAEYSRYQNGNQHDYHMTESDAHRFSQHRDNNFNSAHRTSGKMVTGVLDLDHVGHTTDCTQEYEPRHHRNYKRSANFNEESDMQKQQQEISPLQTGKFDETHQTRENLQLVSGRQKPSRLAVALYRNSDRTQNNEDFSQQIGGFDELTPQTIGKLEFGQAHQQYQPQKSTDDEYATQQTVNRAQQTEGKLEFGQQTQKPHERRKPTTHTRHLEDFVQQPGRSLSSNHQLEDLTQQSEDLTQQTGGFDDFAQQTTGNLHLGQRSEQSWRQNNNNQHFEDLAQQAGKFDDLTRHTTDNLEFGQQTQQHYQPWRPNTNNERLENPTQKNEDLTQQTSGKLEFGQQTQQHYQPWKPNTGNEHLEDLTQQNEDLTQQTTGKLEFGQQSQQHYQPWKPNTGNEHLEDLTQQNEDLTQQTTGKLEFGQQSQQHYQPWNPNTGNEHLEDLTQQNEDLTQQTTGKLEFGQQSQQHYQPWKPNTGNEHLEDLTQQNEDLTQQTTGKLEFGQQTQQHYQPWKPYTGNEHIEDLTQQTTGKLEFGQQTQQHYQPWKPNTGNGHLDDLTQQNEDLSQQTVGGLEFGPYAQKTDRPAQVDDSLLQQTATFDDVSSRRGKLEFGQQRLHPHSSRGEITQQGQELNQAFQIPSNWQSEDLTQQSAQNSFGDHTWPTRGTDITQTNTHHDGELPAKQQGPNDYEPSKPAQKPRPRPRYSRVDPLPSYNKYANTNNLQTTNQREDSFNPTDSYSQQTLHIDDEDLSVKDIDDPLSEIDAAVDDKDNFRRGNIRGDQHSVFNDTSKDLNQETQVPTFDVQRGNADQVNWLQKSNDATVGLQWHYTYHPSDLTNSEPAQNSFYPSLNHNSNKQGGMVGQDAQQHESTRDNENLQQSSKPFNSYEHETQSNIFDQQESQNRYSSEDTYLQAANRLPFQPQYNNFDQDSDSYQQSQNSGFGQEIQPERRDYNTQKQIGQLEFGQHVKEPSQTMKPEHKLEPRILEAYGGGPYDGAHGDDIYRGVTVNPSATLPPINVADPWDVREKPRELVPTVNDLMTEEPTHATITTTEAVPPPSFWGRVGHKITRTFDKAKEKAKDIFG